MSYSDDADPPSVRRRRNSLATTVVVPEKLSLSTATAKSRQSASFPVQNGVDPATSLDLEELIAIRSSLAYTSLKDLLPSSPSGTGGGVNSPTAAGGSSSEISIRNRLVKQAAWAYLQPMSSYPSSAGPRFFRRLWLRFSSQNVVSSCLSFFHHHLSRALDRILRALRLRSDR